DRAVAAMLRIKSLCSGAGRTGGAAPTGGAGTSSCFIGGDEAVSPTGKGELYTLVEPTPTGEKEVEGEPLAEHAVDEFKTQKAEERHRTPELLKELDKRRTATAKAEKVYPLLRRAVITLAKTVTEQEKYTEIVPETTKPEKVDCPEDVKAAAE